MTVDLAPAARAEPEAERRRWSWGAGAARAAGFGLLAIPLLPLVTVFGAFPGSSWLATPQETLSGVAIFALLAVLLARVLPAALDPPVVRAARSFAEAPAALVVGGLLLALAAILLVVAVAAYRLHPLYLDEVVQLFQANVFASGRVLAPAPPLPEFFITPNVVLDDRGWYSQFPPGHAALLAIGVAFGAAWAVPLVLTCATAFLLYAFTRQAYDEATARLTLLLAALSPFFWFLGASLMNHVSAALFVTAFLCAFAAWERSGRAGWMLGAGAALGLASLSRPLDAAAVALAFTCGGAFGRGLRRPGGWTAAAGAVGFLGVASGHLVFNALTTGDPLVPGYVALWGAAHGPGFHESPWGELHTPVAGLRNQLADVALLNVFAFEGPLPALLPLGVFLAAGRSRPGWDRLLLAAAAALPALYFFHWHRDVLYGPRYLYTTLPFLLPLTARALREGTGWLAGRWLRLGPGGPLVKAGRSLACLLVVCAVYAVAQGIPARFRVYASGFPSMKVSLTDRARAAGLREGLIFVPESWGSRLLARLRGLGVPAALAEQVYRETDHCELEELVRRAERDPLTRLRLSDALQDLRSSASSLTWFDLNGDPTLRLGPGARLTPACLEELARDRGGYGAFTPHLPENDPTLRGRLVFARDLGARNHELRALYRGRPAYLWRGSRFEALDPDATRESNERSQDP